MIPNIIHQVWFKFGDGPSTPPEEYEEFRNSWRKTHPDWTFYLWNEENSMEFLKKHYPNSIELFNSYTKPIMKVDAIRYFILHHYGGFYVDMDTECNSSLENLRIYDIVLVRDVTPIFGINNGFIGTIKNHELMGKCIEHLPESIDSFFKGNPIVVTGPIFLTRMWLKHKNKSNSVLLSVFELKYYYTHYHHASWTPLYKIKKFINPIRNKFMKEEEYPDFIKQFAKMFK